MGSDLQFDGGQIVFDIYGKVNKRAISTVFFFLFKSLTVAVDCIYA
jgi:hypothetical protein